jgi:hypothetical protein
MSINLSRISLSQVIALCTLFSAACGRIDLDRPAVRRYLPLALTDPPVQRPDHQLHFPRKARWRGYDAVDLGACAIAVHQRCAACFLPSGAGIGDCMS